MKLKIMLRKLRWSATIPILRLIRAITERLPWSLLRVLGQSLGWLAFWLARKDRHRALQQLATSIPGLDATARKRAVRECFDSLARCIFEAMAAPAYSDQELLDKVVNLDEMKRAMAVSQSGKGAIFVTGHIGNWELLGGLFARVGGKTTALARRRNDALADTFIAEVRSRNKIPIIFSDQGLRPALRVIRKGETVSILADQDITAIDGIFVDFFGRQAWTATAPAALSLATGAPLYFGCLPREGDGFRCIFVGPFEASGETREERIRSLTIAWSDCLESTIKKYPGQWVWMHKRWRNTPERIARRRAEHPGSSRFNAGGGEGGNG